MRKTSCMFFIFAALTLTASTTFTQTSTTQIQSRCTAPYQREFGTIRTTSTGTYHAPCPGRGTVFSGRVDLTDATISGQADFSDATIKAPFRLLDKNFLNFQGVQSYLSIGNNPSNPITIPESGLYAANVELELRGDQNAVAQFNRLVVTSPESTTGGSAEAIGVHGLVSNPADLNASRGLMGVRGVAYQRAPSGSAFAYGGRFEAFTGGNQGGVNPTPMIGVYSTASGGHNGTSSLVIAGRFNVSNIGGGGVGNITEGIAVHAQFDGGFPRTNYITAKGLALQGWGPANEGTYTNSYGIYADSSIDRGTANRFFIYSLSTSPSLFSGTVRVAEDVYVTDQTKGIVLRSPDGTCYRFTVANGGTLNAGTAITCP